MQRNSGVLFKIQIKRLISSTTSGTSEIDLRDMPLPVIVLNVADHVNDVREQSPDVLVRKAATRFTLKNFEREIVEDRRAVVGVTGSNRTRVPGKH